jgi:N-acetylated-alpha-linked acidic dipeptidase
MGFGEAQELLSRMGGPEVPADWRGGLNLTYRIGPGFRQGQGQKLQLDVQSSLEVK